MSTSSPLNKKLKEAFSIDGRALVAYRVALGLCVLLELLARLPDIKAHYTDAGILPRAEAWAHFPQTTALSIHFLFGGQAGQGLLFALTAAAAGLLISGYRARFAAIASWYLVISLQSRNEMVLYGGDHYLRILLFWAMFLPLGPKAKTASALLSPWTVALLLQVSLVYLFASLLKSGPEWHDEASALYYALNYETLTSWFGIWLRSYPALLKMITRSVVPFELSMPVLLLLPFGFPYFRLAALALAVLFHLGIMLCLRLYYFPHVCLVALIPFVPCLVWNRVWPSGSSQDQHERLCGPSVAAAATLLGIVVAWNVSTLGQGPAALPKWLQKAVYAVRLDQDWGFYSPYPYKDDGWYVIPAVLGNGNIVDLFGDNGHALTWTRPASLAGQYPNQHWAAFHILMRERGNEFNYLNYSRYLCRQQKTMSLKLVYMLKLTLPDGPATARPIELYSHSCL